MFDAKVRTRKFKKHKVNAYNFGEDGVREAQGSVISRGSSRRELQSAYGISLVLESCLMMFFESSAFEAQMQGYPLHDQSYYRIGTLGSIYWTREALVLYWA